MTTPRRIIISRTDSIGDVMLTLPMCGWLKQYIPGCHIVFLGRSYTRAIAEACSHIDDFLDWDTIKNTTPAEQIEALAAVHADCIIHVFPRKEIMWVAKRAGISTRIASGHRLFALTKCNKLVFFSRKNSALHESQLNFKLFKPLGIPDFIELKEVPAYYGFQSNQALQMQPESQPSSADIRKRIVFHPLSKGSAVDWPIERFRELARTLPADEYTIYITGTAEEGDKLRERGGIEGNNVIDVTGKFQLAELIAFIDSCDALVAASTGPLHIAAALGKHAIGLYSPKRPIHPGRWSPVGKHAHVLCAKEHPKRGEHLSLSASEVQKVITTFLK
jgi:ADP-heptose:LPS heptosyltransferase